MSGLLAWVPEYGLAALVVLIAFAAVGVPLPATLLLVAVGALVAEGQLPLWPVLVLGTLSAVLGDQAGYFLGRLGRGRTLRFIVRHGRADELRRAQVLLDRWGAPAVFFTRWLVGPLGPWVNVSSGFASYPWRRFLVWDVLGEAVWVMLYVTAGRVFSDEVETVAGLSADLAWALVGLLVAAYLGWQVRQAVQHRAHRVEASGR